MDGSPYRFLVVENEYLIALDASGQLTELFGCDIQIGKLADVPKLAEDGPWHVALVDTEDTDADAWRASLLVAHGAAIVFLSAYSHLQNGVPGCPDWPVVMKPFSAEALSLAVAAALQRSAKA